VPILKLRHNRLRVFSPCLQGPQGLPFLLPSAASLRIICYLFESRRSPHPSPTEREFAAAIRSPARKRIIHQRVRREDRQRGDNPVGHPSFSSHSQAAQIKALRAANAKDELRSPPNFEDGVCIVVFLCPPALSNQGLKIKTIKRGRGPDALIPEEPWYAVRKR